MSGRGGKRKDGGLGRAKSPTKPGGGQRLMHVRVKSAAKRTTSSARWLERQLNDPYVAAAKRAGLRSRAAYKLMEIDDKHKVLRPGMRVIDLGAAPGGWSQVAAERVLSAQGRGQVVAIDYIPMEPIPGVEVLQMDFTTEGAQERIRERIDAGRVDVVLSDMAAPTVGHARTDHLRIMGLAETAAAFASEVLVEGGTFLCKVFQGGAERDLLDMLKRQFRTVRHVKPPASRKDSAELYVLAMGFRGSAPPSGDRSASGSRMG